MLSSFALEPSPDPSPASSPSPSPPPSRAALPLQDKASALPLQDKLGEDVHMKSEADVMAAYGLGGGQKIKTSSSSINVKLSAESPICIASDSECSPQKVAPNSFFREAGQSQKIKFEEMLSSFGGGGCTKYLLLRRWAPPFEEVFAWCVSFGGGAWAPPKN